MPLLGMGVTALLTSASHVRLPHYSCQNDAPRASPTSVGAREPFLCCQSPLDRLTRLRYISGTCYKISTS